MPVSPFRVLLVEDDDAYAALVRDELESSHAIASLTHVRSMHEAIAAIRDADDHAIDAILLDLSLPDSSGLATVEAMLVASPHIPILVLTAADDDSIALRAIQRGAQDYLVKGTADAQTLGRALRYARERHALRRALFEREEELRRSAEQLRQAQKMEAVGRLAGGVAHDFNNLLTAIFGYADLLLDQFAAGDPRRGDVEEIRRSAERAAALTRQLLAFSRKQVMQRRTVSLNDVVRGIEGLVARLITGDIRVFIRTADDLWDVRVDPGQIEQVLMNLAANARDAMPNGGELRIETMNAAIAAGGHRDLPPGDYVSLVVSDTGIGIPEHVRRHIFEPFFTTKEFGKGTGLGLATVYGIVKQMGGAIEVQSGAGKGTRFVIMLPRATSSL